MILYIKGERDLINRLTAKARQRCSLMSADKERIKDRN